MLTSAEVSLGNTMFRRGDGGVETADTGTVVTRPTIARVDDDVTSRFATCCRALGLTIYDRRRPADLTAARSGFAALSRIAHDQCDAWVGLAAAGATSTRVLV